MSYRRFLQFRFTTLLGLMTGVAIGFAPLKLWEVWRAPSPTIVIQMQFVAADSRTLDELLDETDSGSATDLPRIDRDGLLLEKLQESQATGAVQILSSPSVMTLDGQPATVMIGGEIPVLNGNSVQYRPHGYQYHITPKRLRNGQIRLDFDMKLNEVDPNLAAGLDGNSLPGFRQRRLSSQFDLISGQIALVGTTSPSIVRPSESDRQVLVFVSAHNLDSGGRGAAPGPLPLTARKPRAPGR